MDATERLPLYVFADGVEIEAARAAHQQPPALLDARPGLREQRIEADEPRKHEQRTRGVELDLLSLEPERVVDRNHQRDERVAAARDAADDIVAA